MRSEALFSRCRLYRYTLWRVWDQNRPYVAFIGLNPSTADEVRNDPTVRRCIGYAQDWKFGGMCMLNIFAYRATDPKVMFDHPTPVGPRNDHWIRKVTQEAGLVVAAWGNHGQHLSRSARIMTIATVPMKCLGVTGAGMPKHPLYVRKDVMLEDWAGRD